MPSKPPPLAAGPGSLPTVGSSVILPDPQGVLTALSRIGYDLEVALADLVDNSIDAQARNVLIRFYRTNTRLLSVAVVDDGLGMSETRLEEAMGFGVDMGRGVRDLGKYGMGLKAASFSQCDSVTVISRRSRAVAGRRWTTSNIRAGWVCEHIAPDAAARHLTMDWAVLDPSPHGTAVHWDDLDGFRVAPDRADGVLEDYFRRITLHLGLCFHRFLASGRLAVHLDAVNEETGERGSPHVIEPLDPFAYPTTGHRGYPRTFVLDVPKVGRLDLTAHIWPRRSRHPGYRLGGGQVSRRQGFYFYRNDRLIQAGGWNGWRDDAEPHVSLARVGVDLPGKLDHAFGLNVQKSAVSVPPGFLEALPEARSERATFADFLRDAVDTYRGDLPVAPVDEVDPPLVPDGGMKAQLKRSLRRDLVGRSRRKVRGVSFQWVSLPDDQFFEIDRRRGVIRLNNRYRSNVLHGTRASATDAQLVKTLLFLLLEEEVERQRNSEGSREWLAKCQSMLVAAVKEQKS